MFIEQKIKALENEIEDLKHGRLPTKAKLFTVYVQIASPANGILVDLYPNCNSNIPKTPSGRFELTHFCEFHFVNNVIYDKVVISQWPHTCMCFYRKDGVIEGFDTDYFGPDEQEKHDKYDKYFRLLAKNSFRIYVLLGFDYLQREYGSDFAVFMYTLNDKIITLECGKKFKV